MVAPCGMHAHRDISTLACSPSYPHRGSSPSYPHRGSSVLVLDSWVLVYRDLGFKTDKTSQNRNWQNITKSKLAKRSTNTLHSSVNCPNLTMSGRQSPTPAHPDVSFLEELIQEGGLQTVWEATITTNDVGEITSVDPSPVSLPSTALYQVLLSHSLELSKTSPDSTVRDLWSYRYQMLVNNHVLFGAPNPSSPTGNVRSAGVRTITTESPHTVGSTLTQPTMGGSQNQLSPLNDLLLHLDPSGVALGDFLNGVPIQTIGRALRGRLANSPSPNSSQVDGAGTPYQGGTGTPSLAQMPTPVMGSTGMWSNISHSGVSQSSTASLPSMSSFGSGHGLPLPRAGSTGVNRITASLGGGGAGHGPGHNHTQFLWAQNNGSSRRVTIPRMSVSAGQADPARVSHNSMGSTTVPHNASPFLPNPGTAAAFHAIPATLGRVPPAADMGGGAAGVGGGAAGTGGAGAATLGGVPPPVHQPGGPALAAMVRNGRGPRQSSRIRGQAQGQGRNVRRRQS